jgi:hypothetical protein
MGDDLFFYQLLLLVLLWLYVLASWEWTQSRPTVPEAPMLDKPPPKRRQNPKPFAGLTHTPRCPACAQQGQESATSSPSAPPPVIVHTRGCPRQVDPSAQFCPNPDCDYYGWAGFGNLQANGHPSGGPWRQFHCVECGAYFLDTVRRESAM